VECAKPQAATKFLSHAGKNVSRKSRKPAQLKAFSFKDYQLITKLSSIMSIASAATDHQIRLLSKKQNMMIHQRLGWTDRHAMAIPRFAL